MKRGGGNVVKLLDVYVPSKVFISGQGIRRGSTK